MNCLMKCVLAIEKNCNLLLIILVFILLIRNVKKHIKKIYIYFFLFDKR